MGNQNSRLLLEAASNGSLSKLKSVLGKADVNATDQVGCTTILVLCAGVSFNQEPCESNHHEIFNLLSHPGRVGCFALQCLGRAPRGTRGTAQAWG